MKAVLLILLLALAPWPGVLPEEEPARLEGMVVEQGTGKPIARARALLAKGENLDPKDALSALSDSDGKFTFSEIPPGVYRLFVGHSAYVPAEYGQRAPGRSGSLIVLTDGESMHVSAELQPAASVHGKVVNQHGAPASSFVVKMFRVHYERGERVFDGGEYAVTEENGEFRLFGLAPGWYFLRAVPAQEYTNLPLNADVIDWPAYYGGSTEDDSKPIRLEPGLAFEAGTLVTPRGPAAQIRGLAINAATGKPDPDARILLGRQRRSGAETAGLSAPGYKTGYFELAGAAPGDYVIDAVTPSLSGSASFQVRGSNIEELRILLYPRVNVSGRARMEGAAKDSPVARIDALRVILDAGRTIVEASIDSRGAFTLMNVPAGDYRISLSGSPSNVYVKTARIGGADVTEGSIRVDANSSASLELTLAPVSSVLTVIVLDSQRRPAPGATVALVPQSRRLDLYRNAVADKSGNARFEGIVPGDYRLYSWQYIEENAWQDPDILAAYESSGESVSLKETGISIATVTVSP